MATHERMRSVPEAPVIAAAAPAKPGREAARRVRCRSWRAVLAWPGRAGHGISLEPTGPVPGAARLGRVAGPLLVVAVTAFAAAQYAIGRPLAPEAWLAIAPLLASLALGPLRTTLLAAWTVLLGLGLALQVNGPAGRLASSLAVLALLAGFGVANSVLRSAAQRRLGQARAGARPAGWLRAWPCWRYWPDSGWPTPCSARRRSGDPGHRAGLAESPLRRRA